MLRRGWPVVLGFGFAMACRGSDAPKRGEHGDTSPGGSAAALAPKTTGTGPHVDPSRPVLPVSQDTVPLGSGVPTAHQVFMSESPDPAWKQATEHRLHEKLAHLAHVPSQIECRSTQCRITVVGSQQDLAASIDELQGESGLLSMAQSMVLTAPENLADGKLALDAYARFDRASSP